LRTQGKETLLKNIGLFIVGAVILIVGISLILLWWPQVVIIFKGIIGIVLALVGLIALALIKG